MSGYQQIFNQALIDVGRLANAEVRALVNYTKALIDLYQKDGSLLERRSISAPGKNPVSLPPVKK